jgi:D-alanyl-D-alanine endopeptidase (penicillin-binding protein 7)
LDDRNVSTAQEVAKIIHYSYQYPLIKKITSGRDRKVVVVNRKARPLQMANTNLLVISPYEVLTGKTGYTKAADYCVAALVQNSAGEKLTAVVLGAPGDKLRFREIRRMIDWGYKQPYL